MKILKLFLAVLVLTAVVLGQFQYEEKLFVPWGTDVENVKYRVAPGGQYGPTSFDISNGKVIVLDAQNHQVKVFKDNQLEKTVKVPFYNADDILWNNENNFYILSENKVCEMNQSTVKNHYQTSSARILFSKITRDENGQIALTTIKQTTLKINTLQKGNSLLKIDGIPDGKTGQIKTVRKNSQIGEVQLADNSSYQIAVDNLGVIQYLGATPEGFKYLLIEQITQEVPLKVARFIYLMDDDGKLKAKFNLPNIAFTYIFKEFNVDENGNLYQMISDKDGIHIIKWNYENNFSDNVSIIEYPKELREKSFHYNEFEYPFEYELPNSLKKKSEISGSVTRADALATADPYIVCEWTGSSSNKTNGVETLSGASVETPSSNNGAWWIIGSNTKVPYQWGGYSTLSDFETGIQDGKKAGDMQTSGVNGNSAVNYSDVEGVDCSGYVSRIWTSGRETTSSFHNVSSTLGSWNDMKPADAANYASHHIRLNVERNSNGSFLMAEAAGSGWGCRYANFSTSALSSYSPIRYDNIIDSPTIPTPELVTVKIYNTDYQQTEWSCSDPSATGGHNVYRFTEGGSWELAQTVNSSILTSYNLIGDGVASFYKVKSKATSGSDESMITDTYGVQYDSHNSEKFLIVDGFDRIGGDFNSPYHEFAMDFGMALRKYKYSFETCSNDAVIAGDVNLSNYDAVFWNLGDESTADETFSSTEQTKAKTYLQQGGKLFVSGAEVGWDLDYKGGSSDKDFYNGFLKANYEADDSDDYSVYGESGTVFAGLSFGYDDGTHGIWNVDYPDVISTNGGSSVALRYSASKVAGIQYSGTVSGGSSACKVVYMGFPFATIYDEQKREDLAGAILDYFGFDNTKSAVEEINPTEFKLIGNYPNPFNNSTIIKFNLPISGNVKIDIFNINGQRVATAFDGELNSGINNISFTSENLSSGIYIYRVMANSNIRQGKMMLIK
ncbi:MAG: T9SS type A sorting domain-containing protein [Candidatus Marinimicrobia bacterium]|nr:T9SS type A sorting domain-containing protein [Candidatus Neomarinimicrobiota bacterium]